MSPPVMASVILVPAPVCKDALQTHGGLRLLLRPLILALRRNLRQLRGLRRTRESGRNNTS